MNAPSHGSLPSLARPRRLRQRGRAVALWALALYALAQLAAVPIKDRWRPGQVINEDCKWLRLRQLTAAEPDRPLVLMLGSSRTAWAFRAGRLNGMPGPGGRPLLVYNYGVPAAGPIHEWLYLRELLDANIRPRLLLVEFLPPLLGERRRGVTSEEGMTEFAWFTVRQFLRVAGYFSTSGHKGRTWFEAHVAPWYAFRTHLHDDLKELLCGTRQEPIPAVDEWGWRILPEQPPSTEERANNTRVAREMYGPGLGEFRAAAGPIRALHDLLARCRRERIKVALVRMPESAWFRALYSPEATATARGVLDDLGRKYAVDVIDARRWLADNDFWDGHHAAATGAEAFTARLRGEVQRLLPR